MLIHKAFKYRIYPNKEQEQALAIQFNCARFVYNWGLAARKNHYEEHGKKLGCYDTIYTLVIIKKFVPWLKKADSQILQQSLLNLEQAYVAFFEGRAGYPNFKKKSHYQSVRYPQRFQVGDRGIRLPKVGYVRAVIDRPIEGKTKNCTVSKTKSGKYFVSIQAEQEIDEPTYQGGYIGLDLGLKDFAVTSGGQKFPNPKHLRKSEKRLAVLNRRHSRKQRGSKGQEKARLKVARTHEKIANQRKDFLHKLSRQLVEDNQLIAIEDLNIKGMVKNHKLAKSISDAGWSEFVRQLKYKGEWYGCHIEKINRFSPSSKRCSYCGYINQDLTLKDREWTCIKCGNLLDRDINAANNILMLATAGIAGSYAAGQVVNPAFEVDLNEGGSLPFQGGFELP